MDYDFLMKGLFAVVVGALALSLMRDRSHDAQLGCATGVEKDDACGQNYLYDQDESEVSRAVRGPHFLELDGPLHTGHLVDDQLMKFDSAK